jgi:hypothetical protein
MAAKKSKTIPKKVVDQLLQDLSAFTSPSPPYLDPSGIGAAPMIRIATNEAPIYPGPRVSTKKTRTLPAGTEGLFIGSHNDFVGFEFEDKPVWTAMRNVEMPANLETGLPGSQDIPMVRIARDHASIFPQPKISTGNVEKLRADTELPFIGLYRNLVGFEHNKKPFWTSIDNVDIDSISNAQRGSLSVLGVQTTESAALGLFGGIKEALLRRACALRDQYRDNPYVTIKGFSIEFGLSPSLSIDFEFKD